MKKYGIKLFIFLVAFIVGTITILLFSQKKSLFVADKDTPKSIQTKQSDQSQTDQISLLSSLSFDGDNHGCGNFLAYKSTKDNTKVVGIRADTNSLKLSKTPKTFDIGSNNLQVFLYDFGEAKFKGYEKLCFDDVTVLEPVELAATSGKATISISTIPGDLYNVTIILENVTFQISDKNIINLEKIEIKDVTVGFLMG